MNPPAVGVRMVDVHVRLLDEVQWDDALVLVAFPTTGSASSIAAHYLRQHLDLPLVGSVFAEDQLPIVAVHDGVAASPVRIFGGETQCELGSGRCPRLYLVMSDLALDPRLLRQVAGKVLETVQGARLVLCLDAVVRDKDDDTPDVYAVAADPPVLQDLELEDVEPLGNALIAGMTGEILLKAPLQGMPVGGLVVEATAELPDGRAAAALVQAVAQLFPSVPVETKPLLDEATRLEKDVQRMQREAQRTQGAPRQAGTFI